MTPLSLRRPARLPNLRRALAAAALASSALAQPLQAQTQIQTQTQTRTPAPAPLSLDDAVERAGAASPRAASADALARAAGERLQSADRLPDPTLSLGLTNLPIDGRDRFSLTRDFMTMRSVGLMQEFTRSGKRAARAARAQGELGKAQVEREAVRAELRREAAQAWLERSFGESLRELLQAQLAQAQQQVEVAQTLHLGGRAPAAEVFAARAAVEQLRDALAEAELEIETATTRLARWLGEGASSPLAPRPALRLPAWTQGALAEHLRGHPVIAAAAQEEALAQSDAALARAQRQADWSVGLMYSQRGPAYSNMVSINLSVPLQWDAANRQERELAASLLDVERARALREDAERAHEAEVRAMLRAWQRQGERLERYERTLLPLALQRAQAALAAYGAGRGTLEDVLDARRSELEANTDRLRIETERARLWAGLSYLLPISLAGRTPLEAAR